MRVLWWKAPVVLLRHPAVLAAVLVVSLLAALAAAAAPFVRAGVQSESLHNQLTGMTPLAAGMEIHTSSSVFGGAASRRAAVAELTSGLSGVGPVVATSEFGVQLLGPKVSGDVVAMARDGAVAHVRHLTPSSGPGVWISDSVAKVTGLRPGGEIELGRLASYGHLVAGVKFRVAGIYASLDGDLGNPYWQNFIQQIRSPARDAPPQPSFVLMSRQDLAKLYPTDPNYTGTVFEENIFELPIDAHGLSLEGARAVERRIAAVRTELRQQRSAAAKAVGCGPGQYCTVTSSLSSAVVVAQRDVAAVGPTVSLLSDCAILIALATAVAAGVFLVRRRAGEAFLLYARGESVTSFTIRTAFEALPGTIVGAAAGFGLALAGLATLAPGGALDSGTVVGGVARAAVAAGIGLVAFAAGAAAAFPRRSNPASSLRVVARLPWELLPLAAAGALLAELASGGGLTHDAAGAAHPRLTVFVVPVLAVAGLAGLVMRLVRRVLAGRGDTSPPWAFLALRRLAAARGLLAAVVVTAAAAFGALAYSLTLSASLTQSATEKAYLGNGSDVVGVVDPVAKPPRGFPFPLAIVQTDFSNVTAGEEGASIEMIAGSPTAMAGAIRWDAGWGTDPRPLLQRLQHATGNRLAAIATNGMPDVRTIEDQGTSIPVTIVGRVPAFPGTIAGTPALVVSVDGLQQASKRAGLLYPPGGVTGYVWVRGPVGAATRALQRSSLDAYYVTGVDNILHSGPVRATTRTYGFLRVVATGAGVLSLFALLLYLQARQRTQLIASALAQRMGLSAWENAAAVGAEAAAIAFLATVVGAAGALVTAIPIVRHVDPLPDLAPGPSLVVPWLWLVLGIAATTLAAGLLGAAAASLARRASVAEALRVA